MVFVALVARTFDPKQSGKKLKNELTAATWMKQLLDGLDGFRYRALGDVAGGITGACVRLAASGEFLPLPLCPPRMGGASPVPELSRNLFASLGSSGAMGDAGTLQAFRQPATRVLDVQP